MQDTGCVQGNRRWWPALAVIALLLGGCATQQPNGSGYSPSTGVVQWRGKEALVPSNLAKGTQAIYQRLSQAAGLKVPLRIDGSRVINASAHNDQGQLGVVINAGMLDFVGYDPDELAFVLAHELAHVDLGHLSASTIQGQADLSSTVEVISMLADFILPFSGLAISAGYEVQTAGYSREQEIAADQRGVELMQRAGYNPSGALRFQHKLLHVSDPSRLNLLSSHPPGQDRIEALKALLDQ